MRIIPWVDPFTNEPLEETDTYLTHNDTKYPIINGVPKFVKENYSGFTCHAYRE